jgi:putative hydrolase of the HAD superfamily
MIQAVIWDFGGVFTTSPFEAFARFERERGLPEGFLRQVNGRNYLDNAWARFERNEITPAEFDAAFAEESRALGHEVRGLEVIALLSGDIRPEMVRALEICAGRYSTGCITNNVLSGEGPGMARDAAKAQAVEKILALFDHIIESSKAGVRKPDPRIYQMMCEALDVPPGACVYLDDLGVNLKPARALGMITIKVENAVGALAALEEALGHPLR